MQAAIDTLLAAIVGDNREKAQQLLKADAALATRGIDEAKLYEQSIFHWIYVGDTALHLAAAGHRVEIVELLIAAGADPNADGNHRRSRPLHYAADGYINGPAWDAKRQVETIRRLLHAGAEIHAQDNNGASALHRAVRTRCAAAVKHLLEAGSNPAMKNKSGSTPFHLAVQTPAAADQARKKPKPRSGKSSSSFCRLAWQRGSKTAKGNQYWNGQKAIGYETC